MDKTDPPRFVVTGCTFDPGRGPWQPIKTAQHSLQPDEVSRDAHAEIQRLRTALKNAGELLGGEGFFRRAESIEAFLRGEQVDWLME